MPILASSTYVHGYGKSALVAVETGARNLNSLQGTIDTFVVKYNTLGKALWSARISSVATDQGFSITSDSAGNVYVTGSGGSTNNTTTAFNSDGTVFLPPLASSGSSDAFIIKYNTNGFVQWAARVASSGGDIAYGIATDPSNNVYLTVQASGVTTAFNSDAVAFGTTITSSGGTDALVIKYNANGFVQWIARISSGANDIGYAIACDLNGNAYVTGNVSGTGTAFSSNGSAFGTTIPSLGGLDAFVVKYDTNGLVQWITRIASDSNDRGFGITTDSTGSVYVVGGYPTSLTTFNSGGASFGPPLASVGGEDVFIVKYDTNGFAQWATRISGGAEDRGNAITADSAGNVYVTGRCVSPTTAFNANGIAFSPTIPSSGGADAFIVKYNTNGVVQWITRIGSSIDDLGLAIAADSAGNVYVTGESASGLITAFSFNGTGTGSAFGTTISNSGGTDAFIVKYNTSGVVQWVTRVASPGADSGRGITVDSNSNVYMTGQFQGVQFSIYGQSLSLFSTTANAGLRDAFIVKYNTNGSPQWVATVGGSLDETAFAIATDSVGNVYVTGSTGAGTATPARNADGTQFPTLLPTNGGTDVDSFIVKYNTNGFVQWMARVASSGTDRGFGIATDSVGNVYVTGQGGSAAVITAFSSNGVAFGTTLANSGNTEAFIVKYNTNGFVQWVARVGGTGVDIGFAITADLSGNVYLTGQGQATIVARSSSGNQSVTIANSGAFDAFIVKYNTDGFVEWMTRVGSGAEDIGYGIATDTVGNVYVTGQGGNTSQPMSAFDASGSSFINAIPAPEFLDAFVVKYNANGFVQWIAVIQSNGDDEGFAIATDPIGNIYVVGRYGGNVNVRAFNSNGTPFLRRLAEAGAAPGVFIVKYNTNGFVQWITEIFSPFSDIGYSVKADLLGNVYVTTTCSVVGTTSIFNSDTTLFTQIFTPCAITKYDTNGFAQWVQTLRGNATIPVGLVFGSADTRGLSLDTTGNVYITGATPSGEPLSVYNVDGTPYRVLNTLGGSDAFIVKYSPNVNPLWVARVAGAGAESGFAITTDSTGNVYVTGTSGATDTPTTAFNSDGTAFLPPLGSRGNSDTFIIKYNTNGFVQWTARVGSTGNDTGQGILTDSTGNVYVTGGAAGAGTLITSFNSDGTAFPIILGNLGGGDAFIVKYNSNGFVQWATRVASTSSDTGFSIAIDTNENVYVGGRGQGDITVFNSDTASFASPLPALGNLDTFIVKYNSSGFAQWAARVGSIGADVINGVATDSAGNVYVTGQGGGATVAAFNSNGPSFANQLINAGGGDAFVVKYNTDGFVQWVARVAGAGADIGFAIATDSAGNVYVTGQGGNAVVTVFSSNGVAFSPTLANSGGGDAFIVKYNTDGFVQWVTRVGSVNQDRSFAISIDSAGDVYVTGGSDGGNSSAVVVAFNSDGSTFGSAAAPVNGLGTAVFIVKYNSNGFAQWISFMNGSGSDQGRAIRLDSANNIYVAGSFDGGALIPFNA